MTSTRTPIICPTCGKRVPLGRDRSPGILRPDNRIVVPTRTPRHRTPRPRRPEPHWKRYADVLNTSIGKVPRQANGKEPRQANGKTIRYTVDQASPACCSCGDCAPCPDPEFPVQPGNECDECPGMACIPNAWLVTFTGVTLCPCFTNGVPPNDPYWLAEGDLNGTYNFGEGTEPDLSGVNHGNTTPCNAIRLIAIDGGLPVQIGFYPDSACSVTSSSTFDIFHTILMTLFRSDANTFTLGVAVFTHNQAFELFWGSVATACCCTSDTILNQVAACGSTGGGGGIVAASGGSAFFEPIGECTG